MDEFRATLLRADRQWRLRINGLRHSDRELLEADLEWVHVVRPATLHQVCNRACNNPPYREGGVITTKLCNRLVTGVLQSWLKAV